MNPEETVIINTLVRQAFTSAKEADVEEISCNATGAQACEFKVKLGGK